MKRAIPILFFLLIVSFFLMPDSVQAESSGTCGDNLTWTLSDSGTLTISGNGDMTNWVNDTTPWEDYKDNIKSVVIKSGVTSIGTYAFSWCYYLKSITFESPSCVTKIGGSAFNCCSELSSITIPDGVEEIGMCTFSNCSSLTEITIPGSMKYILTDAFLFCNNLKTVTISEGPEYIPYNLFRYCPALETVSLPSTVTSITDNPFAYCTSLTNIIFPNGSQYFSARDGVLFNKDGTVLLACPDTKQTYTVPATVTSIGDYAFYGCESLTSITVPANVTSIGSHAFFECASLQTANLQSNLSAIPSSLFDNCYALKNVTIPANVTSIGDSAFSDCSSLKHITIPAKVTSIDCYAFSNCSSLEEITFLGNVPTFDENAFINLTTTAYYPAGNETWTDEVLQDYGGTITWEANDPIDLSTCTIGGISDETYTGTAFEPEPTVTLGDKILVKDKDFSFSYRNNTNAGTATVIVTGIGRYSNSAEATFRINPAKVAIPSGKTLTYNGEAQTGVDESDSYTATENSATNAGSYTATVSLKDKNNTTWSDETTADKEVEWTISPVAVAEPSGKTLTFNGKAQKGVNESEDYTATGNSATKAGSYTATVSLKDKVNTTWNDGTTADKAVKWKINKAVNPLTVKAKTATVKYSKLKKKTQTLAVTKVVTFTKKGAGNMTYSKVTGNKKITINKTTGKVTVKKGLKKSTYKVKIKVKAVGNANYKASAWKTLTITIKVK